MSYSAEDSTYWLQFSLRFTSSLSIIGTIAILTSFVCVPKLRTQMNQLVVFMSIGDLFSSLAIFLGNWTGVGPAASQSFCQFQAFNIQLWFISASLWTCCMATHCVFAVISNKPLIALSNTFVYYHLVSWGIPLVFAVVPFILQALTPSLGPAYDFIGSWCWISKPYGAWRIIIFYGPLWIMFVYNVVCYTYVGYKIRAISAQIGTLSKHSKRTQKHASRFVIKTLVYMLAFVINWTASTANRVQNLVDPDHPIFGLTIAQTSTIALNGALNCIIYFGFAYVDSITEKKEAEGPKSLFTTTSTSTIMAPIADYKEGWA